MAHPFYSAEQIARTQKQAQGKTIESFEFFERADDPWGYWTITFTDGSEMSVRLMVEVERIKLERLHPRT